MDGNDIKDLIDELLTCRICEGIGCRKDTALLLFSKCQHYFCEKCVTTMGEREQANDKKFIECPLCREQYSLTDETSTPPFRYAESLANKVLDKGRKKKALNQTSTVLYPGSKPVFLKTQDVSRQQIIQFMELGQGCNLFTSAGVLSADFGNTGLYLVNLLSNEVVHFGELGDRYNGLASTESMLAAVNYTKWRIELYNFLCISSKCPKLFMSWKLKLSKVP